MAKIQESKARCTGPQEEGDEESDPGEEEKETGAKASARSGGPSPPLGEGFGGKTEDQ